MWNSKIEIFTLDNGNHTECPAEFDKLFEAALEENPALSIEELTKKLNSNHATVHLQQLKKVLKLGKWVPLELFENNLKSRVNICSSFYSCPLVLPFLNRLVTCDKKWIFYRRQWLSNGKRSHPKREFYGRKVLLSN